LPCYCTTHRLMIIRENMKVINTFHTNGIYNLPVLILIAM